jgi:lipopolysaccharide transport system ATP-binding protein
MHSPAPRREPVDEPVDYGSFDIGLVPESTVEYGLGSACIENVRILDPDGKQVNVLRPGCDYRYAYEVKFIENAYQVRFGMLIKLVSGFELGGQVSHPMGDALEAVEPDTRVHVEFAFVARLVPGTYFVNAGVLALRDGEEVYLHRMVDALMFKILPAEQGRITGHLDFSALRPTRLRLEIDRSR